MSDTPDQAWTGRQRGALLLVVAVCLALGWFTRLPELGTGEDEAVYLLLSESLAAGHYRDLHVPGHPPHAKYPPGTSAWILAVRSVAGPDLDAVRVGNLLLVAVAGGLLALGWKWLGKPWIGIGAAAITAWNPSLLRIATTLSSEPLYLALATAAIVATLGVSRTGRARWKVLTAALAIASFATRTAGVGLLAGIGCWALVQRRWRFLAAYSVTAGAVVLGWFWYLSHAMAGTVAQTYALDLPRRGTGNTGLLLHSLTNYAAKLTPAALNLPMIQHSPVDNLLYSAVFGVLGVLGLVWLLRHWPAAVWSTLAGMGVLVIWGWAQDRLLLPLLPWIASAILIGAVSATARVAPRYRSTLPVLLGVGLCLLALRGSAAQVEGLAACRVQDQYTVPGCAAEGERALVEAARGLADSLPPGAVVVTAKPSTIFYLSRVTVVPFGRMASNGDLEALLAAPETPTRITHILLTPLTSNERGRVAPLLASRCEQLSVQAQFGLGALLLSTQPTDPIRDACGPLQAFSRAFPPFPQDQ